MRRIVCACLAFAAAELHAAHPLITEDTGTQGKGRWQLEVFGEDGRERASGARLEEYGAVLSRGIAENADLQFGLPWQQRPGAGPGDASLDLKWRFYEKNALSLGLKPGLTLPTGDEGEGRGTARYTTLGAIWSVTRGFDLDAGWRTGQGGTAVDDLFLLGATWRW